MKNLQLPLLIWLACLLATALPPAGAQVPAVQATASLPGEKVALLIGNSKYKGGQPGAKTNDWRKLENAAKDATDLHKELKALGFLEQDMELLVDGTRLQMLAALDRLRQRARQAKQVVVYYAGHGVQHEAINYMLPIDANAKDGQLHALEDKAILLEKMVTAASEGQGLKVVLIDACRTPAGYGRGSYSGGLTHSEINKKLPPQTVVVFAAAAGEEANDSGPDQRNGYFAQGLLQALRGPDLSLRHVMLQTETAVAKSSENQQNVTLYGGLRVQEHFKFGPDKTPPPNTLNSAAPLPANQTAAAAVPAAAEKLPELEGFTLLPDGGVAKDPQTNLEWMRCSLGQTWSASGKTCQGEAKTYTFEQAQQAARDLNAQGGFAGKTNWRVPTARELFGLVRCDKNGFGKYTTDLKDGGAVLKDGCLGEGYARPTIAQEVFPNTPANRFWTSTPLVGFPVNAWGVYFGSGVVYYVNRGGSFHVRLVR